MKILRKGQRVSMTFPHPWEGENGTIEGGADMPWGNAYIIKLDNGQSCYSKTTEVEPIVSGKKNGQVL